MAKPTHLALVGSGLFVSSLIIRWIFDRGNIRLHKILGSNFVLFSAQELDMVRALLDLGYYHCFKSWPRLGINDAEKRAFLHTTSRSVKRAVTSNEATRMNVLKAPVAIQKPYTHTFDGDSRYDPFHWLRNDSRDDPEVLEYIKAENEYCQAVMADTVGLQDKLFKEMKGRIQEEDCSVPVRDSGYYYYTRTLEGKQYGVHCRRKIPEREDGEIVDEETTMDTSVPEEVILDENVMALKHKYYSVCDVSLSENGKLLAYSEDTVGNELYSIRAMDLSTRKQLLSKPIGNTSGAIEWAADNNTFFYITQDDKQRPYRVFRTSIDAVAEPELVFEELDQRYNVSISKSTDKKLIWIVSGAAMQNEMLYVLSASPKEPFKVVLPRVTDVDYSVEHWHGHLFMVKRTSTTPNSEVYICPLEDPSKQRLLRAHTEEVKIEDVHVFKKHIALLERTNGLSECHVFTLPEPDSSTEVALDQGDKLSFDEDVYVLRFAAQGEFDSTVLSLYYSSLAKPGTWMAQNMLTGNRVTRKVTKVLGGFDQDAYVTARLWAPSHDGIKVPISLVYNKNLVEPKSNAHLHLDAYGAYEIINEPSFSRNRISLLDRGVICAIAHVRGGGDMGRQWYETGKFLKKRNTFYDVIACAEHLIKEGWTSPSHMCLEGGSAGGMTVGAVANMRPELFQGIVAGVPFVDCLTTMLDDTIPLTTQEYEEWGNPNEKEYYEYMKSYSPLDNVKPQDYPHLLVTSGFHDPRVAYWEPTKWVAKLRLNKTDNNMLIHKIDMGAGHFSQSGRFDILKEAAVELAFILKCFGKHVDVGETAAAEADVW